MKVMSKILAAVLITVIVSVLVTSVTCPLVPHEYTLDIPCYAPTKITFNYAYTHNHSLRDISTVGASLYKHTGGPTFIEFIAEDIDTYRFTVELHYTKLTNQSIVIGIWSGTQKMQGFNLFSVFEKVSITIKLSVSKEPTYPSEMEVAQAVTQQLSKDLADTYIAIQEAINTQNLAVTTNSILSVISVFGVMVLSIAYYLDQRRRGRQ